MKTLPTIEFLASLAEKAGKEILPLYGKVLDSDVSGKDLHIEADTLSEKIIIGKIKQVFPDHSIFSEETVKDNQEADFLWVIDPLDGTVNFSQGIPLWAISIAFRLKGEVVLGAIFLPVLKEVFTAEKGKGAYLNGKRISVSKKENFSQAVTGTDFSYDIDLSTKQISQLVDLNKYIKAYKVLGSAATALAWTACGRLDAFFHKSIKPYDVAAGSLLIKEAGGMVTRLDVKEWDIFNSDILAGGPSIHSQLFTKFSK